MFPVSVIALVLNGLKSKLIGEKNLKDIKGHQMRRMSGFQPPAATRGSMINANRAYRASAPWMVFAPGLMIYATALRLNVPGDSLRDLYGLRTKGQDQSLRDIKLPSASLPPPAEFCTLCTSW